MDLLVNPTPENSARISRTLDGLHMNGFIPISFTKPGLQVPLKQLYYAELLTPPKDGPTYFEITKDAVDAKLFSIPVRLASVVSLIRLKEQSVASVEDNETSTSKTFSVSKSMPYNLVLNRDAAKRRISLCHCARRVLAPR